MQAWSVSWSKFEVITTWGSCTNCFHPKDRHRLTSAIVLSIDSASSFEENIHETETNLQKQAWNILKHLVQIISQLFVVCLNRTLRFMAIHLYPTTEISLRLPWSHGTSAVVSPEPPLALASPLRASDQWWHPLGGNTKMDFRWLKVEWVSSVYHMARVLSLPWFRILGKSCFLWKLQGRTASPSLRILGYDFGSPESDNPCSRIMVPWELRGT